jgi:pyrroloquinoline quinone biosynthesis protein B
MAVIAASGAVVLFDASPDIRVQSQMLLESPLYPTGRDSLVDSVFITHAHMGHYAGLLHFGKEAAAANNTPLFATHRFLTFMEGNEPWATLVDSGYLDSNPINGLNATIDTEIAITAIPVPHRDELSDTVAFSVWVKGDPWALYLPDIDDWPSWPDAEFEIARHDVVLLDATFSGPGELGGRDMRSIGHPLVVDTIERFAHLTVNTQIVLTHMNHSNPLGDPSSTITQQALDAGFTTAYDGFTSTVGE